MKEKKPICPSDIFLLLFFSSFPVSLSLDGMQEQRTHAWGRWNLIFRYLQAKIPDQVRDDEKKND